MEAGACEGLCAAAIVEFVQEQCHNASLATVAKRFCCHPNSISRLLKRELNVSFQEALTAARMKRASRLLQESELSVTQVAAACGYESMTHFYQAFRRSFGTTPARFRTTCKTDQAA